MRGIPAEATGRRTRIAIRIQGRSDRGATLVEMLVAIFILAIAVNALAYVTFDAITESAAAPSRAQCSLLAQDRMEGMLAHRNDLDGWEAKVKEQCEYDAETKRYRFADVKYAAYEWTYEFSEVEEYPGMRRAVITCWWQHPAYARQLAKCELETLLVESAAPRPDLFIVQAFRQEGSD